MCLNLTFSLLFFVYYSTVNENSTNNVPVVFFYSFIWILKGKCLLFLILTVFQKLNCSPSVAEFDQRTLL